MPVISQRIVSGDLKNWKSPKEKSVGDWSLSFVLNRKYFWRLFRVALEFTQILIKLSWEIYQPYDFRSVSSLPFWLYILFFLQLHVSPPYLLRHDHGESKGREFVSRPWRPWDTLAHSILVLSLESIVVSLSPPPPRHHSVSLPNVAQRIFVWKPSYFHLMRINDCTNKWLIFTTSRQMSRKTRMDTFKRTIRIDDRWSSQLHKNYFAKFAFFSKVLGYIRSDTN